MGFDIAEVCESNQWNCLFYCVLMADTMKVSNELAALRFLLSRFSDVYAVDAFGKTIFDYVDDIDGHGACCYGRDQANFPRPRHGYGTYRRDLLYCALERSELLCGRPDGGTFKSREYRFAKNYTPLNLHALRYLDEWTHGDLWPQVKSELGKHPWSEHEKEEAVRLFQDIERHDWCDWVPEEHIIDLARYLGVSPNQRIAFKHRRRKPRGGLFR